MTAQRLLDWFGSADLAVLAALTYRGFLIEADERDFWLSDNAHRLDGEGLTDAFEALGVAAAHDWAMRLGRRVPRQLLHDALVDRDFEAVVGVALELWERRGTEAMGRTVSWAEYASREYAPKVETQLMDRDVALLVKGLSACAVMTTYSCAGHDDMAYPRAGSTIELASEFDGIWAAHLVREAGANDSGRADADLESIRLRISGTRIRWASLATAVERDSLRRMGAWLYTCRRCARARRDSLRGRLTEFDTEAEALSWFREACRRTRGLEMAADGGLLEPWLRRSPGVQGVQRGQERQGFLALGSYE